MWFVLDFDIAQVYYCLVIGALDRNAIVRHDTVFVDAQTPQMRLDDQFVRVDVEPKLGAGRRTFDRETTKKKM